MHGVTTMAIHVFLRALIVITLLPTTVRTESGVDVIERLVAPDQRTASRYSPTLFSGLEPNPPSLGMGQYLGDASPVMAGSQGGGKLGGFSEPRKKSSRAEDEKLEEADIDIGDESNANAPCSHQTTSVELFYLFHIRSCASSATGSRGSGGKCIQPSNALHWLLDCALRIVVPVFSLMPRLVCTFCRRIILFYRLANWMFWISVVGARILFFWTNYELQRIKLELMIAA